MTDAKGRVALTPYHLPGLNLSKAVVRLISAHLGAWRATLMESDHGARIALLGCPPLTHAIMEMKAETRIMTRMILLAFSAAIATTCLVWGSMVYFESMIASSNLFAPIGGFRRQNSLQVRDSGNVASTIFAMNHTTTHYTPPAFEQENKVMGKQRPSPIRVMEQYIEWHSVEALRRDPHNRRFSVVFYSCPLQAGNRIHHFISSVYWSIVTNRTMLFKYWDRDTCYKYGSMYSLAICREANVVQDCDAILARAPWIPNLDDWQRVLRLPKDPIDLPFYATHPRQIVNHRYPWGPGNDNGTRGVDVRYDSIPLVMFSQTRSKISFMDPRARNSAAGVLLHSERGRWTNDQLHSLRVDFLFGMIQRYCFDLTGDMYAAVPREALWSSRIDEESTIGTTRRPYTIALHSRHIDESLDGCDISREKSCVNQLLKRSATVSAPESGLSSPPPCSVAVMSDRSCTISALSKWLEKRGCRVYVAHHDERIDYLLEHGPFAGAGFFQDVALATTVARSGFVGMLRSSSDLVLELMQFHRTMEAWERSNESAPDLSDTRVDVCVLSRIEPPLQPKARANQTEQAPQP